VQLAEMIRDPSVRIREIAAFLDGIHDGARRESVRELDRDAQRTLYEKAAEGEAISLEHFVADAGPRVEVVHEGMNTLPLPPQLRRFQKRFCRPEGSNGVVRLFGYNEGPTRKLVGPGFFVAVRTNGRPDWESRGAVVIDYYQVPDGAVAEGWPEVIPNSQRLQRFVYHQTRDFMRRVSTHVSIGAAYKREKPLDHYFVLCRTA
jgi:hypothetical protein